MRGRKRKYFLKLLQNGIPSALALIGALITPLIWLKIVFIVVAVGIYAVVAYNQAAAMVDNDDFHERIGASVEGLKRAGLVPKSISVNGKKIRDDKE